MTLIRCYHVKHKRDFSEQLNAAKHIADYAVQNKNDKKQLSTAKVKHYGLHSDISNQILRKYGRGTIKKATNVNLIVPNTDRKTSYKRKDGTVKSSIYNNILYENGFVIIKPLKIKFRWNPGKQFIKINQLEIDNEKFMICVSFPIPNENIKTESVLGIDLNCGVGRAIANCANLKNGEILNLGKQGPNIKKSYFKKRKNHKIKGHKEKRKMKDLDHKISKKIVDYAEQQKLKIVVEDLTGIRKDKVKGKGSKTVNRFVNSWSFYRLQTFIEYKAKERNIPFEKINPQYTSKECSFCSVIGNRNRDVFICTNKHCKVYNKKRHSDVNAAFNIGKRSLLEGGRAQ